MTQHPRVGPGGFVQRLSYALPLPEPANKSN